jgi:hypothetical protein
MRICVYKWGGYDYTPNDPNLGLKYDDHPSNGYRGIVFEVKDKHIFMLAVIKYGIEFKEV